MILQQDTVLLYIKINSHFFINIDKLIIKI